MNGKRFGLRLIAAIVSLAALAAPAAAAAAPAAGAPGGWGWWDAAIWGGAFLGIVCLGFWGDVVLGAVIYGVAVVVAALLSVPVRWARSVRRPRPGTGRVPTGRSVNREAAA